MKRRLCDACGTPLPGKGQGFVVGNRILCGRVWIMFTGKDKKPSPGCGARA